mmetsp:Transcript_86850/g.194575  ORF Transcript_86850/g.194575 Transcript_86850/m.194575 type:complete len:421 (+) Transcript_86850:64-1326(+)
MLALSYDGGVPFHSVSQYGLPSQDGTRPSVPSLLHVRPHLPRNRHPHAQAVLLHIRDILLRLRRPLHQGCCGDCHACEVLLGGTQTIRLDATPFAALDQVRRHPIAARLEILQGVLLARKADLFLHLQILLCRNLLLTESDGLFEVCLLGHESLARSPGRGDALLVIQLRSLLVLDTRLNLPLEVLNDRREDRDDPLGLKLPRGLVREFRLRGLVGGVATLQQAQALQRPKLNGVVSVELRKRVFRGLQKLNCLQVVLLALKKIAVLGLPRFLHLFNCPVHALQLLDNAGLLQDLRIYHLSKALDACSVLFDLPFKIPCRQRNRVVLLFTIFVLPVVFPALLLQGLQQPVNCLDNILEMAHIPELRRQSRSQGCQADAPALSGARLQGLAGTSQGRGLTMALYGGRGELQERCKARLDGL